VALVTVKVAGSGVAVGGSAVGGGTDVGGTDVGCGVAVGGFCGVAVAGTAVGTTGVLVKIGRNVFVGAGVGATFARPPVHPATATNSSPTTIKAQKRKRIFFLPPYMSPMDVSSRGASSGWKGCVYCVLRIAYCVLRSA